MDTAWSFGIDVRWKTSREAKRLDKFFQSTRRFVVLRVETSDGAFHVEAGQDGGCAVTRACDSKPSGSEAG